MAKEKKAKETQAERWRRIYDARRRILCGRPADRSLKYDDIEYYVTAHDAAAARGDEAEARRCRAYLVDRRKSRINWNVADEEGEVYSDLRDGVSLSVLMDLRDGLDKILEAIEALGRRSRRTSKPRLRAVKKKAA